MHGFRSLAAPLLALAVAAPRAIVSQVPADRAALAADLGRALDSLAARDAFSGVVLLARGDSVVFERAVGLADRATRRPNDVDTHFNLGSIDKLFTATAVRQLVDAGKLDMGGTIGRYWPDYPNADVARRVTIRQLLTMSSGLQSDIFRAPPNGDRRSVRHNRDYLPLFVGEAPAFEPGTQHQYSNAGFVVLGALVERASGQDYYDYVRQHVFQPAGMTQTGSWSADSLPPDTAVGYTCWTGYDPDRPSPSHANTDVLPGRGSAAGGGYSTARDMLRYLRAVDAGTLPSMYPGWTGGGPGVSVVVDGGLPDGYRLVVLANVDPQAAVDVAARVRRRLGVPERAGS